MEFVIGVVIALGVGIFTTLVGMDRDKALYPATLIVIASLYDLFAVMGGSSQALVLESIAGAVFIGLAATGFKSTLWLGVAGLAGHGIFDLVHAQLIQNPGVPVWWPMWCLAYDVTAAVHLAILISRDRILSVTT
jgi:hypothetical protein